MIIPFNCPACGATIEAEVKGLKRRVVTCSSCEESVQVPEGVEVGPGVVIGNGYKLEEKLGESSLGDMYVATKESDGKRYSVEILSGETSRDQEKVTRLMQETDLVATLQHPNIVAAIEAGQDSETYFLVTDYEPGKTLQQYIADEGPIAEETALSITADIASALQYAWNEKKICHRDVKPPNIFVTEDGTAKLTGFGIATSKEGQSLGLTGVGFTIGTPEYMSPEQIRGADDLNFSCDLYSLGIVTYEMVTGELPFQESAPLLLVQKHMDETPEPANQRNSDVSVGCSAMIDRMLLKEKDERQESWQALLDEIEAVQAGGAPSAGAVSSSPKDTSSDFGNAPSFSTDSKNKNNALVFIGVGIGIVVILLLVLIVLLITRS